MSGETKDPAHVCGRVVSVSVRGGEWWLSGRITMERVKHFLDDGSGSLLGNCTTSLSY
jgi:hypothetical protein